MGSVKWRFLYTGKGSAFFNMALDEVILNSLKDGDSPPTFRLYEWEPHAITFGYNQSISDIIDIERCKKDGVDITKRLTGGRAVFHENEVAYSVTGMIDDESFGGSIMDTYKSISKMLVEGLSSFGIAAEINRGNLEKSLQYKDKQLLPCFLTTSKYEITLGGKKLVGSAQRRFRKLFIQQGSIIIGHGHEEITKYMKNTEIASLFHKQLNKSTINLKNELNGNFSLGNLRTCLYNAFKKIENVTCMCEKPTPEELEQTDHLMKERYSSKGWIFGDE